MATAGETLRADMDAELARRDPDLEWGALEVVALAAAAEAADRAEALRALFAAEADPSVKARLSAEVRQLDKAIATHLGGLSFSEEPVKSSRHQLAAHARWDARRDEHEALRQARGY